MISTSRHRPEQLDFEPWEAMLILQDPWKADQIAHALFTTPKALKARLAYHSLSAIIAARHIRAAITFLQATGRFRQPTTSRTPVDAHQAARCQDC